MHCLIIDCIHFDYSSKNQTQSERQKEINFRYHEHTYSKLNIERGVTKYIHQCDFCCCFWATSLSNSGWFRSERPSCRETGHLEDGSLLLFLFEAWLRMLSHKDRSLEME